MTEPVPAEDPEPVTEPAPSEVPEPATEIAPVEKPEPVMETATAEDPEPVTESVPAEESEPMTEATSAEEPEAVTETVPAEEPVPVSEPAPDAESTAEESAEAADAEEYEISEIAWEWDEAEELDGGRWACTYSGEPHMPAARGICGLNKVIDLPVRITAPAAADAADTARNAGIYTAEIDAAAMETDFPGYVLGPDARDWSQLEIRKYPVMDVDWEWTDRNYITETQENPVTRPAARFEGIGGDGTITVSQEDIRVISFTPEKEIPNVIEAVSAGDYSYDNAAAVTASFVNAGTYAVEARIGPGTCNPDRGGNPAADNYELTEGNQLEGCKINPEKILSLTWNVPSVYTGAPQDIIAGSVPAVSIVFMKEGEEAAVKAAAEKNAGLYQYRALIDPDSADCNNYKFPESGEEEQDMNFIEFTIKPRSITVYPDMLTKKFGEKDPQYYTYDENELTDNVTEPGWAARDEQGAAIRIREELPDDLLVRTPGELVGTYRYSINQKYRTGEQPGEQAGEQLGEQAGEQAITNYAIEIGKTVNDKEPVFEIRELKLKPSKEKITSREKKIGYSTDLSEKNLDHSISRKLVITAKFPEDTRKISFPTNLEDFIADAADGILFTGEKGTLNVKDVTYSTTKHKVRQEWTGKLPAGTELILTVYGRSTDESLNEEWTIVSNPAKLEVIRQPAAMMWSSTSGEVTASNYLGKGDKLRLTALETEKNGFRYDSRNEVVEVAYNGLRYYQSLDVDSIDPYENNSGSGHMEQTASAAFVDVLNLEFSEASCQFIYDNGAFDIPAENIRFSNRDKKISVELPETGTIKNVTIPGGDVKVTGAQGDRFELDVAWSGRKLISSGGEIRVTYVDRGGNEGRGSAVIGKSAVSTGLQMSIRPETNARGYLNGQTDTLIISGLGCVCEPIGITVAGSQARTTNVTIEDVWNDEAGSWEVQLNMHDLPESDEPFAIHAEYLDVDGPPADLSVKYNDFVAPADVVSPLFRAMPFISGMAEPDAAVQMYIGKDADRRFEACMDSFGHFVFDDIDLMMPGDTFTVIVTDVAGNRETCTYTIPGPDEDGLLTAEGTLGPLGRFVYIGQKGRSETYSVTPVRIPMSADEEMTIPLLFGSSYKAGAVTVSQTDGGIVVSSELDPEVFTDPKDYTVIGDTFYVYTSKPSAGELAAKSGTPYHFGDVIRTDGAETIWIADGRSLKMRASDVSALDIYNFRPSGSETAVVTPEKNREFQTYYGCQTYSGQALFLPDDDGTFQR